MLTFLAAAPWASAGNPRDIVFECPCSAEWVAGAGGLGTLELTLGAVRSHRATESGEVLLAFATNDIDNDDWRYYGLVEVGRIPAAQRLNEFQRISPNRGPRPSSDSVLEFQLSESSDAEGILYSYHESLTLWPVQDQTEPGRIRYVDILTDVDGDGVGDVNERIAGTNPLDPASTPGESTVDVLWLYDDGAPHGAQYAQTHHLKVVANTVFGDSGTNIRLRTVGIARIEKTDPIGWPDREHLTQLMDLHGADLTHQVGHSLRPCVSGCARAVGGSLTRGLWAHADSFAVSGSGALTVVHELGHVMGLVHSAKQGEAHGTFRWSRGHYLNRWEARYEDRSSPRPRSAGTIMSYGEWGASPSFSDPAADCNGEPCGVPATEAAGADARRSLDLVRFQIAAHRDAKPDSDGDGFVDDADDAPRDPKEWIDHDADGLGDNADPDDDNDGVNDGQDRWPLDPQEWEDLDGDGVGDNADDAVEVHGMLDPFRDAALRRAVERTLGKSAGDRISAEEIAGLRSLFAINLGIRDLTGLELATGLKQLYLGSNSVSDLTPLAELTKLGTLSLSWNPIVDLSPLKRMSELRQLTLDGVQIVDLSPLAGLTELRSLSLNRNQVVDLSSLAGLKTLETLYLSDNRVVDLSPLTGLTKLTTLELSWNLISDVSSLAGLTDLQSLTLEGNDISDVAPLSGLQALRRLLLTSNRIADLSPLQGLTQLETLGLGSNHVSDLSPLAGLTRLRELRLEVNRVADLSPLAGLTELRQLWLGSTDLSDLSPLAGLALLVDLDVGRTNVTLDDVAALPGFRNIRSLGIAGLGISDVSPLAALSELERLALEGNSVADISPLAVREIWSNDRSQLHLRDNPLDEASIVDHVPLLQSWGVRVNHENSPTAVIPDARLHSLVAQQTAFNWSLADARALSRKRMEGLYELVGFNAGVSDLTGLEWAINLQTADLGSNSISDVSPLVGLDELRSVELSGNPLTEVALNDHVAELRDEGVEVRVKSVVWEFLAGGETARFEVERYFESLLGSVLWFVAVGDDPDLATVEMVEGALEVSPRGASGVLNVTVTATGFSGQRATLRFDVRLLAFPDRELGRGGGSLTIDLDDALGEQGVSSTYEAMSSDDAVVAVSVEGGLLTVEPRADGTVTVTVTATAGDGTETVHSFDVRVVSRSREVSYMLPAGDERRQGFVRVINHSAQPGEVSIEAFDEAGTAYGPLTMPIAANGTLHFTSEDLERGNAGAGLSGGVGTGQGGWRLALQSERDIEVLSYIRTADGFLTAMHDVAPEEDGVHGVAIFKPGSDTEQVSMLRLVNTAEDDATVTIRGIDEAGMSPGSDVQVSVPAGQARSYSAADLEAGTGVTGALGDGAGQWQLVVSSDATIRVMNLLESPGGYLSNLSTVPDAHGDTWTVPLFPSASNALQREGLVRVINRGDTTAEVSVQAFDESVRDYDPLTLTLEDGKTVNLGSNELELGNTEKGLSGSTGAGIGDWWLELASESDIEVLSYIRTPDGFFTSVHDVAPSVQNRHRVATFNPDRNVEQVSRLRMINAGAGAARVTIRGVDDDGHPADEVVRTTVPGRSARTFTAMDLELGAVDLEGALGTGTGMWRLTVESDRPIMVMSLLDSPTTRRLTNLSTVPQGRGGSGLLTEEDGASGVVETTYEEGDVLPGVPTTGGFAPTIVGDGSFVITGSDTTISLNDGSYFELDDGTRYTCRAARGCKVLNGNVTAGTVVGRPAGAGEVDRFPSFRTATAPGRQSYTVGTAIDTLTLPEASGGNGTLSYSLAPSVPGLSFDATTRRLTGTPTTAVTYDMTYTVTDEDGDTDTLNFTISVSVDPSGDGFLGDCYPGLLVGIGQSCAYPGTTDEFSVNARGRGSFLGRLAGIRIRIDNQTIDGRIYDFLASHQGDGVWRIDRIAGSTEPPPNGGGSTDASPNFPADAAPGNQTYAVGTAIDSLTLAEASGGDGPLTYSLSPDVPGLTFNATARQLTGTPTAAASYNMTYTVTDEDGDTDTLRFSITVSSDSFSGSEGEPLSQLSVGGCAGGRYVPNPDGNPGLVGDCRTLVEVAQALARNNDLPEDHVLRRWGVGDRTEMASWPGIELNEGRLAGLDLQGTPAQRGAIADISPLSRLTGLTWLNLDFNAITDLSPLSGLIVLTRLELSYNRISDVAPLSGLIGLTDLSIYSNRIADISPLSGLTDLTSLHLSDNAIVDVTALSGLTNLSFLGLDVNSIVDITPIRGLAQLTSLSLGYNAIVDVSPLSGLSKLTYLGLSRNAIVETTPLSGLSELTYLGLSRNAIVDVSPLSGLAELTQLRLDGNGVLDISPLSGLTNLTSLHLGENAIADITALSGFTNLTELRLAENAIVDISPLSGLAKLTYLDLARNAIVDISPLVANSQLGEGVVIELRGNPLSDVSIDVHIAALKSAGVEVKHPVRLADQFPDSRLVHVYNDNVIVMQVDEDVSGPWLPHSLAAYATDFYSWFDDEFDYLIFHSNMTRKQWQDSDFGYIASYYSVMNDTRGLGSPIHFNSDYGSAGRLRGAILIGVHDQGPWLHELMHAWANFAVPTTDGAHWGFSSANGHLGGFDIDTLMDLGNGRWAAGDDSGLYATPFGTGSKFGTGPYSPIELYFAGLAPPDEVPDLWVAEDGAWEQDESGDPVFSDNGTQVFTAKNVRTWSMEDIVALNGARNPSGAGVSRHQRAAVILLTDARYPLTSEVLQAMSESATRFGLQGDDGEPDYFNYWEATLGRATLTLDGLSALRKRVAEAPANLPASFGVPPPPHMTTLEELCGPIAAPSPAEGFPGSRDTRITGGEFDCTGTE